MKKLRDFTNKNWKQELTEDDLCLLLLTYNSSNLDDLVFLAIIFSSFHAIICLGESTQLDTPMKCSFCKVTLHHSVKLTASSFSFVLPTHKADRFFGSSTILIESHPGSLCPLWPFWKYLAACNAHFPLQAQLWLCLTWEVPTYSWVVHLLKSCLGDNVTSHSLHSSWTNKEHREAGSERNKRWDFTIDDVQGQKLITTEFECGNLVPGILVVVWKWQGWLLESRMGWNLSEMVLWVLQEVTRIWIQGTIESWIEHKWLR